MRGAFKNFQIAVMLYHPNGMWRGAQMVGVRRCGSRPSRSFAHFHQDFGCCKKEMAFHQKNTLSLHFGIQTLEEFRYLQYVFFKKKYQLGKNNSYWLWKNRQERSRNSAKSQPLCKEQQHTPQSMTSLRWVDWGCGRQQSCQL